MIIYATKQTIERYKLTMPNEFSEPMMRTLAKAVIKKEQGDRMLEWGAKLFYFDRRKCIQLCHFASKLTIILVDIKMDDVIYIGYMMSEYMHDIYADNKEMTRLLDRFCEDSPAFCFSRLTDRSIIASLNSNQRFFLDDGYRLYDYIENNVLHTKKLNRFINKDYPVSTKKDGKDGYFYPAERFEQLLKERYK